MPAAAHPQPSHADVIAAVKLQVRKLQCGLPEAFGRLKAAADADGAGGRSATYADGSDAVRVEDVLRGLSALGLDAPSVHSDALRAALRAVSSDGLSLDFFGCVSHHATPRHASPRRAAPRQHAVPRRTSVPAHADRFGLCLGSPCGPLRPLRSSLRTPCDGRVAHTPQIRQPAVVGRAAARDRARTNSFAGGGAERAA